MKQESKRWMERNKADRQTKTEEEKISRKMCTGGRHWGWKRKEWKN